MLAGGLGKHSPCGLVCQELGISELQYQPSDTVGDSPVERPWFWTCNYVNLKSQGRLGGSICERAKHMSTTNFAWT